MSARQTTTLLAGLLFLLSAGTSAHADLIGFDFNSLQSGQGATSIQTYMNSWLTTHGCAGCSVAVGSGAVADQNTYTGDGHVVGPKVKGTTTSLTLGNTEHAVSSLLPATAGTLDTYIRNIGGESSPNDRITMVFTGFSILSASFDFEIFPDGSGQQPPDLAFIAKDKNGNVVFTNAWVGAIVSVANTTYTRSPASNSESSRQLLGTFSQTFNTPVTELDFVDWPATIGIDNLEVSRVVMPEPGAIVLFATGLVGVYSLKKKRKA
jgi:hypothetical protein